MRRSILLVSMIIGTFVSTQANAGSVAGPDIYVNGASIRATQQGLVEVRARGFSGIRSLRLTLTWDSTQLVYSEIDTFSPIPVRASGTGTAGQLSVQWTDPDSGRTVIADDSVLFAVYFIAIGFGGDSTLVGFTAGGTSNAVTDTNGNNIPVVPQSGVVRILGTTGIAEPAGIERLSLYPNPATGYVTISAGQPGEKAAVSIIDMTGRIVYSAGDMAVKTIDVASWQPGLYTVQMSAPDGMATAKLTIVR